MISSWRYNPIYLLSFFVRFHRIYWIIFHKRALPNQSGTKMCFSSKAPLHTWKNTFWHAVRNNLNSIIFTEVLGIQRENFMIISHCQRLPKNCRLERNYVTDNHEIISSCFSENASESLGIYSLTLPPSFKLSSSFTFFYIIDIWSTEHAVSLAPHKIA